MRFFPNVERARCKPAAALLLALAMVCITPIAPASGVVGGALAAEETVPWFASWSLCGGTLVAPDRVLTAGHCLRGRSLSDLESIRVAGTVRRGVRVALHPDWRHSNGRYPFEDVALIQLDMPVTGVPQVSLGGPLPQRVKVLGRGMYTAPEYDGDLGETDDLLRVAELRALTDARCARDYRHRRGSENQRFRPARMFCTTDIDGLPPISSACFGDSGGPLYSGNEVAPVLHGIVSWGGARCGADRLPTVYASVKRARRFIAAREPKWAPVPDGPTVISGRATPGHRLKCILPSWSVRPTRIRVRWDGWRWGPAPVGYRPTYTVRARDAGHELSCNVKASNAGGSVTVPDGPASWVHVPRQ
jgi:hypothetical protein